MKNKKIKFRICVITVLIMLLIVFLPDMLFGLRNHLKELPILNYLVCTEITDKKYTEIMLTPIFNSIAILVSVFALYISKKSAKTQELQHKAKIMNASLNIREVIDKNMKVMNKLKENVGDISKLNFSKSLMEDAIYLHGAGIMDKEQLLFFRQFMHKIEKIKELHDDYQDENKKKAINEFCSLYFEGDTLNYVKKLQNLNSCLDKIFSPQ